MIAKMKENRRRGGGGGGGGSRGCDADEEGGGGVRDGVGRAKRQFRLHGGMAESVGATGWVRGV